MKKIIEIIFNMNYNPVLDQEFADIVKIGDKLKGYGYVTEIVDNYNETTVTRYFIIKTDCAYEIEVHNPNTVVWFDDCAWVENV